MYLMYCSSLSLVAFGARLKTFKYLFIYLLFIATFVNGFSYDSIFFLPWCASSLRLLQSALNSILFLSSLFPFSSLNITKKVCDPYRQWTCSIDGSCIDRSLFCDGAYDCVDGTDEFDCPGTVHHHPTFNRLFTYLFCIYFFILNLKPFSTSTQ